MSGVLPDGIATSFVHYFGITSLFGSYVLNHSYEFLGLDSIINRVQMER